MFGDIKLIWTISLQLSSSALDTTGPFQVMNAFRVLAPDATHTMLVSFTPNAGRVVCSCLYYNQNWTGPWWTNTFINSFLFFVCKRCHKISLFFYQCLYSINTVLHLKVKNTKLIFSRFKFLRMYMSTSYTLSKIDLKTYHLSTLVLN